jgi:tetratricopeptide (TPR) repeat protein
MLNAETHDETGEHGRPFRSSDETHVDVDRSSITLPPPPAEIAGDKVRAWAEPLTIDTYLPCEPDGYPAFFESRMYQGSSGKVYPLPFQDRIAATKAPHSWEAVHLENDWVRLAILPQLGGRIHVGYDKVADYDFFYRNNVIKPALVGLAGPWLSGGVEFNWPQHHRPATMLPTDFRIEKEPDGSITVWCSDHDPFSRMKGMHGIRLRPDSSVIEARVRLFNRSERTQTFLWWANVAAAVNDDYQSFFPTDVHHVADHARRSIASFPRVEGRYYGIDYSSRVDDKHPDADRLDWYRNIPVPTSYMVLSTNDDFFGGYDHSRRAGFVHWADRRIAPGKKQWTWGNADFGRAWDANLTDSDGPYIELMAGVYTDNQPDFSFLLPGETKTFSQFWYPIQEIGIVHQASRLAAVHFDVAPGDHSTAITIGVATTEVFGRAKVVVSDCMGSIVFEETVVDLAPGQPYSAQREVTGRHKPEELTVSVSANGAELMSWTPPALSARASARAPSPSAAPLAPGDVATSDELFFIAQYLDQYRHPTRCPEPYWREALARDAADVRCNVALASYLDSAGRFSEAEQLLRTALGRQLQWVPNPADGEAHYLLGLVLGHQGQDDEADAYFSKATWNAAWRVPAHYGLAKLLARSGDLVSAEEHLREVLQLDSQHLQASDLLVAVLRKLKRNAEADRLVRRVLSIDPLDQWALDLSGGKLTEDPPTLLDIALEYASVGFTDDALRLLDLTARRAENTALGQVQVGPLASYHAAVLLARLGRDAEAQSALRLARTMDSGSCLPSRHDDVRMLEEVLRRYPDDARAAVMLGSWYYDKRRYDDAIRVWEQAIEAGAESHSLALAHRNLGIASYNVLRDGERALGHFEEARRQAPDDARLLHEADELAARLKQNTAARLAKLDARDDLVRERDDLTISRVSLLLDADDPERALDLLLDRQFQPREGGEGKVLDAWERACWMRAAAFMRENEPDRAVDELIRALRPPKSLGEARHPLVNNAHLRLCLGDAYAAAGLLQDARGEWSAATSATGDFIGMSNRSFSNQTYYSILACLRLGEAKRAQQLTAQLSQFVEELEAGPAAVDYFATSLPNLSLFDDDLEEVKRKDVMELRGQLAMLGECVASESSGVWV